MKASKIRKKHAGDGTVWSGENARYSALCKLKAVGRRCIVGQFPWKNMIRNLSGFERCTVKKPKFLINFGAQVWNKSNSQTKQSKKLPWSVVVLIEKPIFP